jgi:hypothetical protein
MVLYVPMGAPPSGAEARLAYVAANTSTWWGIIAVVGSLFTSALDVSIILASLLTTLWALVVGYRLFSLS